MLVLLSLILALGCVGKDLIVLAMGGAGEDPLVLAMGGVGEIADDGNGGPANTAMGKGGIAPVSNTKCKPASKLILI